MTSTTNAATMTAEPAAPAPAATVAAATSTLPISFEISNLNLWYGTHHALHDINIDIPANQVTALIGPSGCGKSTFFEFTCAQKTHFNTKIFYHFATI